MIIYFYLFIPLVCRLAESSSIKGGGHKNDLVPFLSSRLDPQKDNSLKIVSNEPFIIQFQMPPQSSENVQKRAKVKDKNTKRSDKKRISKIKPLRKKIRKRRDVSEAESRQVKPDQSKKPRPDEKGQSNQIKTQNSPHRLEILKALNTHAKKKETKNLSPEDVDETEATTSRNLHTNHPPFLQAGDSHVRMIYPNTPKSETRNYSYKDLIADRERLEQKINYIRNLFHVNDTTADDGARVRRKSDSDKTANKIAKMFLTLSAVNGLHDKRSKCRENNDDDRGQDIWKKDRRKITSRQSSSSNEERYKVKKWIEYMKSKRSSSKTCPCMANEYNEENDIFPLEQKLAKDYQLTETGASSEEFSDSNRDPLGHSRGRLSKSGSNRNSYRDDARSKLRALANRGGRKYELPVDDLELYRSRAKQILQNAEEILDKIKEEEERRLAAPHAIVSHLRELTSKIQGDPRNNENDLIKIIQKNLGWIPQPKSQSDTDGNSFLENMKAFILDPYEKAKALTDESTKKLSSYLLRNLGKIDSSEEQEAAAKGDQDPQIYLGQVPQNEEMFSANLAKENLESDSLAKEREEHQNLSDTLSAMPEGSEERTQNTQDDALKPTKDQEDSFKGRMEEMIKEQEKKINEFTEKPEKNESGGEEGTKITLLMTGEQSETPEDSEQPENAETFESEKQDENIEKSDVSHDGLIGKESETVKSTAEETESDVIASEQTTEDQTTPEEFAESTQENVEEETDKFRANLSSEVEDAKDAIGKDSSKEVDTIAEYVNDKKDLESVKANEKQEKDVKDVVMEPAAEFEKDTKEKGQSSESSQEQDNKVQSKQDREENDVLNSKHLVLEDVGRSEDEELEELTEDIKKLLEETTKQKLEEHNRTVTKMEYNSAETKDPEEDEREESSSPDSDGLEKQTKVVPEGIQDELSSEHKTSEVVNASQDPKESLQYDNSKEDKASSGKKNSVEDLEETEMVENSEKSSYESEKSENSAEGVVEKAENSVESEKETINYANLDKTESVHEETKREDDTLKSELTDEVKEDDEEVREESDNQEKEILREGLDGVEQDKSDQEEPSLKSSLDESDDKQKSDEIPLQKSLEEVEENLDVSTDESPLRSESPENETLEKSSEQMTVKGSKQSREENEEVDETQDEEASLKASKPENADKIQDASNERLVEETETEFDNRENEPQVKAQLPEDEIDGENEDSSLRSENPEGDPQKSNESLMNTSGSQEKVEAVENETPKEESDERENEESIGETLKSKPDEVHKDTEETASTEYEKVKAQERENENLKENSGEGSIEMNNTPKLLMSIKEEDKETMTSNQEGSKENDAPVGETLNASDDLDAESLNGEDQLRGTNPRAEEKGEMQEVMDDEDDTNVRAENIKDLDNKIDDESFKDGKLRSTIADSEESDEDATLKEVNSLERENFNEDDAIGERDQIKEVTVGKKKMGPASEEVQNSRPNQSRSTLKVPKSIGKIMRDLSGKEKDDFTSLTNLNPENIDHIIDKIDEAEHRDKLGSEDVDCRKECACADDIYTRSRNIGRYEIVKDFLHWAKDLQLNRVLSDD